MEHFDIQTWNDCYGGSGSVTLNKEPSPVEVYNDINGEVVNFFRVLRASKKELIELIGLTPYSRAEYNAALQTCEDLKYDSTPEACIEGARCFFIKARMTMNCTSTIAKPSSFRVCRGHSRRGMASVVSMYLTAIDGLAEVAQRLLTIQIENLDGIECAFKYDSPKTLHYFDPPYPKETRTGGKGYKDDTNKKLHTDILAACHKLKGKIILSSYENSLYSLDLLPKKWYITRAESKNLPATFRKENELVDNKRQEVVYTNFEVK